MNKQENMSNINDKTKLTQKEQQELDELNGISSNTLTAPTVSTPISNQSVSEIPSISQETNSIPPITTTETQPQNFVERKSVGQNIVEGALNPIQEQPDIQQQTITQQQVDENGYKWSEPQKQIQQELLSNATNITKTLEGSDVVSRAKAISGYYTQEQEQQKEDIAKGISEGEKLYKSYFDNTILGLFQKSFVPQKEDVAKESIFNNEQAYKETFGDKPRQQAIDEEYAKRIEQYQQ